MPWRDLITDEELQDQIRDRRERRLGRGDERTHLSRPSLAGERREPSSDCVERDLPGEKGGNGELSGSGAGLWKSGSGIGFGLEGSSGRRDGGHGEGREEGKVEGRSDGL